MTGLVVLALATTIAKGTFLACAAWRRAGRIDWSGPLTAPPLSPAQARFVSTLRRLGSSPEVIAAAMRTTPVTRTDVRKATINALRRTKANPRSLRLTPGQARHIREGRG